MFLGRIKLNTDFNKNVATLFAGTTIAQAIPIAISPILTRIYSPEEFGLFALFFSVANLLGVIATGRYELAIVLPKTEHEALHLEKLCYGIAGAMGVLLLVVVLAFGRHIALWLGNPDLHFWLYFIPLSVFLTGVIQTYSYKLNRNKTFRSIAYLKVAQTSAASVTSVGLGVLSLFKNGLIIGHLIGQCFAVATKAQYLFSEGIAWTDVKKSAIRYKNFALYNAPAALLNTAAASLPILFLSKILKKQDVGFYGLVERSIGAPISLISYSISQVLLEDIASRHRQDLPIRPRLIKLVMLLSLIGIVPFTLLFFYSEVIFAFIFGQQWSEAGSYASILSVAFFMRFVVSPLSMVLVSTNRLKALVLWQILYFSSTLIVVLASLQANDASTFLVALAVNDCVLYSLYLFIILRNAKK